MIGPRLKVAVIGQSGSGKSTCAGLVFDFAAAHDLTCVRVPLARPLYRLQEQIYAAARVPLHPGAQDQLLLESLAAHLRRIAPDSLVADFRERAGATDAQILVNDDLRDSEVDAPALRLDGFRVLRVTCDEGVREVRLKKRGDLTRSDRSTAGIDRIPTDVTIDNSGDIEAFRATVHRQLEAWL